MRNTVGVVHDRERLAPVALAREQPVAQLVLDGAGADAVGLEPCDDGLLGVGHVEAVQVVAVDQRSVTGERGLGQVTALDDLDDVETEGGRELPVALVVAGHGHDRAGAVAGEHVVGDEHRQLVPVDRVHGVDAEEDAGLLLVLLALEVGLGRDRRAVRGDGLGRRGGPAGPPGIDALGPLRCHQPVDQVVLGGQRHVGGTEQRVRTRGEHLDAVAVRIELHLGTVRAPDPVALHGLDLLRPVQVLEVVDQAVGVRGDAHHPLLQVLPEHREVAALAAAVRRDLLVGQHGAQSGAPVDHRIRMVDKAVRVQDLATLHSVQRRPVAAVFESALTRGELGLELGNAPGLALRGVVPGVVDLQEDPLRPVVEVDVRRRDRAALVVAQAQTTQLTLHVRDVRLGRGARMRARLHRVLLGRQTERVVTESVQDVAPLHAVVPREDVGGDVPERGPRADPHPTGTGTCPARTACPGEPGTRPSAPAAPPGWGRRRSRARSTGPASASRSGRRAPRCSGAAASSRRGMRLAELARSLWSLSTWMTEYRQPG